MKMNSAAPKVSNDRFLRALSRELVDRVPIWIMRQAGRYLPEYRATRENVPFLELCKTPELAATVTVQPIDVLGFDAAILFSDILIPLEAMGLEVRFDEGKGPILPAPVRDEAGLARLRIPDPIHDLGFVGEAISIANRKLAGRVPLIGFAGAPWTVATYAVEGGSSKSFRNALGWMYSDPASFRILLDRIADTTANYLEMQVDAGVHAIQIFESWGGQLGRDTFREFALPPIRKIVNRLLPRVPVILYVNGSPQHIESMAEAGSDAVGVDWRLPLDAVRARIGNLLPLQGNLDPCCLYAPPADLEKAAIAVLERGGGVGHVFNLGHGILPDVPVASVRHLIETVHSWKP